MKTKEDIQFKQQLDYCVAHCLPSEPEDGWTEGEIVRHVQQHIQDRALNLLEREGYIASEIRADGERYYKTLKPYPGDGS